MQFPKTFKSLVSRTVISIVLILSTAATVRAHISDSCYVDVTSVLPSTEASADTACVSNKGRLSPYDLPYSLTRNTCDRHRLCINTATLGGAFLGTLLVLECLPEDATSWNRAELRDVPLFKRWHKHVIKKGPEWDHDKFYFNYILHPYAGAAYFMAARSCGLNFWKSFLYNSVVSTVGWEFGIEAFMERPSIQDIFITPIVGSCIGEGFYRVKRRIVEKGYCLLGSRFLGGMIAFMVDPVNEFTGLWLGNPARRAAYEKRAPMKSAEFSLTPMLTKSYRGVSLVGCF